MATIAVIDDDPGLRALVGLRLQNCGHVVLSERNGQTGLATIRLTPPDLVILDWMMPRISGPQVCSAIRADARLRHIPVLMLTARVLSSDVEEAYRVGVSEYMVKPFVAQDLMASVDRLLVPLAGA